MVTIAPIALLVVSISFLGLGLAVYQRAPDRVWNRIFALHAVAVASWVFSNYLIQIASSIEEAALWLRLSHPLAALGICTTLDLAWVFPERIEPMAWPRRVALYGAGLAAGAVGFAPNLLTKIEFAYGTVIVEYGWPFIIFGLFTAATVGYADYVLYWKLRRLSGLQRVQAYYMLVGLLVSQIFAIFIMILLPLVFGISYYCQWGSASYVFVVFATGYAIAKYHIVRPRVALYRVVGYLLATAAVAGLMLWAIVFSAKILPLLSVPILLLYLIIGLALGVIAIPLHEFIRRTLERSALPQSQLQDSFRRASEAILRTLDPEALMEFVSETIMGMLRPTQMSVLTKDNASGNFTRCAYRASTSDPRLPSQPERLSARHILVRAAAQTRELLSRDEIFRFHSLREAQPIATAMEEIDAQIVTPLLWEDELIGLVCIGEKLTGEMYEAEELELLSRIMPQVSLALRNAQLYAETARMREFSENILREMESGVIAVEADGKIVLFNPAAEHILGLSREQAIGRQLALLPEQIANCLSQALNGAHARMGGRFQVEKGNGKTVPVSCRTSHWGGSSVAQEGGAVLVIHDLSLVQELERERREAERLGVIRLLSAGMAHEIRNPLVAIRTFAELLPTHWDDPDFRSDFMVTAQDEIDRIVQLLSQLLMLSKPADAVPKEIEVNEVCEGVVRAMSVQAEAKQVQMTSELNVINARPLGDASRLHQALVNLVANAIDAETPGGQVRVSTEETTDAQGNPCVLLKVHNTGSYIPPAEVKQIFEPFYSQKQDGTGLGLAICQTIVEEHDGVIIVRSVPREGTEFVIQLPVSTDLNPPADGDG